MKLTKIEITLVVLAILSATFTVAGAAIKEDTSALDGPGAYHPPNWQPGPVLYPPPYLIAPTHFPWELMPTLPPQSFRDQVPPPFQKVRQPQPNQGSNPGNDNVLEFDGDHPGKP